MISALALACITAAQPQALSFSHPIDAGPVVLRALGREVGLNLRAAGELTEDRIFVRLRDTDWPAARAMLAEGLAAKWTRRGDVHYLTRPKATKPAGSRRNRAIAEVKKWQEAIVIQPDFDAKVLTERLLMPPKDPQDSKFSRFESVFEDRAGFYSFADANPEERYFLPTTRALLSIFKMMDPSIIADVADLQTRIASPRPFARDVPLPPRAEDVLQRFIDEREVLRRVLEISGVESFPYPRRDFFRPVTDPTALIVKVVADHRHVWLGLSLREGNGTIRIDGVRFDIEDYSWEQDDDPVPEFPEATEPLELTADELAIGRFIHVSINGINEEVPDTWEHDVQRGRALAADPVANERLELICGPVLRQLSDAQNMSVVALLSDPTYKRPDWLAPSDGDGPTVQTALILMLEADESKAGFVVRERDGYWLLTPGDLERHEHDRYDRKAYRAAIALVARSRWFDMEYWRFAFSRIENSAQLTQLFFEMQRHFELGSGPASYESLSLLANLSAVELELARSGKLYRPLASLPETVQRALIKDAVESTLTSEPRKYDEFGMAVLASSRSDRSQGRDESVEGLLAFRNGVPAGTVAKIDYQRYPSFHPKLKNIEGMSLFGIGMSISSAWDIAYRLVGIDEKLRPVPPMPSSWDFDQVLVTYADVIKVRVEWPGLGYSEHRFRIPIGPADINRGPMESLPADVLAHIDRAIEGIKAQNERRRKAAKAGGDQRSSPQLRPCDPSPKSTLRLVSCSPDGRYLIVHDSGTTKNEYYLTDRQGRCLLQLPHIKIMFDTETGISWQARFFSTDSKFLLWGSELKFLDVSTLEWGQFDQSETWTSYFDDRDLYKLRQSMTSDVILYNRATGKIVSHLPRSSAVSLRMFGGEVTSITGYAFGDNAFNGYSAIWSLKDRSVLKEFADSAPMTLLAGGDYAFIRSIWRDDKKESYWIVDVRSNESFMVHCGPRSSAGADPSLGASRDGSYVWINDHSNLFIYDTVKWKLKLRIALVGKYTPDPHIVGNEVILKQGSQIVAYDLLSGEMTASFSEVQSKEE